jgi:sortase A
MGQDGNVALAGHRDTVFRPLEKIQPGDVIEIMTAGGTITYSVDQVTIVSPDDLSVLEPTGGSTLTLITCHPFKYIGSAPNRFIVRAREIAPLSGELPATR